MFTIRIRLVIRRYELLSDHLINKAMRETHSKCAVSPIRACLSATYWSTAIENYYCINYLTNIFILMSICTAIGNWSIISNLRNGIVSDIINLKYAAHILLTYHLLPMVETAFELCFLVNYLRLLCQTDKLLQRKWSVHAADKKIRTSCFTIVLPTSPS